MSESTDGRILALCGGVGGAKLALGLSRVLAPEQLTIVVNTGDDFEHFGLPVCPDLDTVTYTLAGLNNTELGWGRQDESWRCLEALEQLDAPTWFRLGDRDLATHLARQSMLIEGLTLSQVTAHITRQFGIAHRIVPMTNQPVRTMIDTDCGELSFQHYFVRERCKPAVRGIRFGGSADASMSPDFEAALADPDLAAILICPSNPFVSVAPILAIPGVEDRLRGHNAPVIAVSPIVANEAIKGPTGKMMKELGLELSALGVYRHYGDLLNGFVLDEKDKGLVEDFPDARSVHCCNTVMVSLEDRTALAVECLKYAVEIAALRNGS